MRQGQIFIVLALLAATPAFALQCGPYTLEGETTKKLRVKGKIETQHHFLPLPPALSIHSGNIRRLRVSGLPQPTQINVRWIDRSSAASFNDTLPLNDGVSTDYPIVELVEQRFAKAKSIVFSLYVGQAIVCHTSTKIHAPD